MIEATDLFHRAKLLRWALIIVIVAGGVIAIAGHFYGASIDAALVRLFGPPRVELRESYAPTTSGPTFDHARFTALLKAHVEPGGWVDYRGLGRQAAELDRYIEALADAPFDDLGRDEKLALLLNAYNAFTLRLILDYSSEDKLIGSIRDIPDKRRWDDRRWRVGGNVWSLNQIEHEQIRPKFKEPRIHFALVCAAVGCPPLRPEAYVADRLDTQLDEQMRYAHEQDRWLRYDADGNVVYLTQLYRWYGGDFEQVAGSVLKYVARYAPQVEKTLAAGKPPRVEWLDYDWSLNSTANRKED
ncbi:MAG: DUF547 domain-containing protein [Planctomycetota bacterium]|jgi:hypothetical protein